IRAGLVGEAIPLARLGDIPVLAELTAEIAAGRPERKHGRPGIKVVERLFLDRIDTEAGGAPVGGQHHLPTDVLPHEAESPLPLVQLTRARAEGAEQAPILLLVPEARLFHGESVAPDSPAVRAAQPIDRGQFLFA